ncbi:MAG: FAD-dependent oxidoreductase [Firmicutes bacterium]|nr:FAD-dependent oxidoreductase [Bacillota bacterium]
MHERASNPRPSCPQSAWLNSASLPAFPTLQANVEVDVVIVGGGITGVTAAYLLSQAGQRVALLEASRVLHGATGHTTAKVTAQHNLIYDELIRHMGVQQAKRYYEANAQALSFIRKTVKKHAIACQFEDQDAYVYAVTDEEARKLDKEWRAYQTLSIDGDLVGEIPFALPVKQALVMKRQAQFHPVQYLRRLVQATVDYGGQIYEGTTATGIEEAEQPSVVTSDGFRVRGRKVLACTHFPFYDGAGFYFSRLHAERGYIIVGRTQKPFPGGMYISADSPSRSMRSITIAGEPLTLISGEAHKAGQGEDTVKHYEALEAFAKEVLGLTEILYRWSNQDLFTLDKVPYIGPLSSGHKDVLVATGYMKWGMTTGTAAARILCDLVLERENPAAGLFAPSRFYVDPSLKNFLSQNVNVTAHLIEGKFEAPTRQVEDLSDDEGAVVNFHGRRAGAYRDAGGQLFVVDTTCTHMYCEVNWNHGDRTWDCPCHGSRFSCRGEVVEGPAKEPLERLY